MCGGSGVTHYALRKFRRNGRVRFVRPAREVDGERVPHICHACLGYGKFYRDAPSPAARGLLASMMAMAAGGQHALERRRS